jgi:hypothetical protein
MSTARASKPPTARTPRLAVIALRKKARGEELTPEEKAALASCSRPTPTDALSQAELDAHRKLDEMLTRK